MPIRNRLHTLLPPIARMGVCCAVVLFLPGCGGHNQGTVTGIVKYQGKAVPSGQVSFIPPDGIPVTADIRADGSYEAPKVLYGEAIVTVIQRPADYQSPAEVALAGRNKSQPSPAPPVQQPESLLPKKYLNPSASPLRCLVDRPTVDFAITLED